MQQILLKKYLVSKIVLMESDIRKIIEDGVLAPSGENCQPWKFSLLGNVLSVFNVPEADYSLYNSHQKGSYLAHGALLENMSISSVVHGYVLDIALFPDKENEIHVATITFSKGEVKHHPLYGSLIKRCTNRKEFTGVKLTEEEKEELKISVTESDSCIIVDDDQKLQIIGKALAVHERVLFENKSMHDFFYDHIAWDKKDENKAGGFYIETLEFLPHQVGVVKLFRSWIILSLLNTVLGVSKMISKDNGEKYARSGTFAALTMCGTTNKDFVLFGMQVERFWLTATKMGIAVHPCNGTLYLKVHTQNSTIDAFSKKHMAIIDEAHGDLLNAFNYKHRSIGFIFRMGKADEPTARSKRLPPVIEVVTN